MKLKKSSKGHKWPGEEVVNANDKEPKHVGCIIQRSGSLLHPVYTTLYLSNKGWTTNVHQAYIMTDNEAWLFKYRGGNKVWTKLYSDFVVVHNMDDTPNA